MSEFIRFNSASRGVDANRYQCDDSAQPFSDAVTRRGQETLVVVAAFTGDENIVQGVAMDTYPLSQLLGMLQESRTDLYFSTSAPGLGGIQLFFFSGLKKVKMNLYN